MGVLPVLLRPVDRFSAPHCRAKCHPTGDHSPRPACQPGEDQDSRLTAGQGETAAQVFGLDRDMPALDLDLAKGGLPEMVANLGGIVGKHRLDRKTLDERRIHEGVSGEVFLTIVESTEPQLVRDQVNQARSHDGGIGIVQIGSRGALVGHMLEGMPGDRDSFRQNRRPPRFRPGQRAKPDGRLFTLSPQADQLDLSFWKPTDEIGGGTELDRPPRSPLHQRFQELGTRNVVFQANGFLPPLPAVGIEMHQESRAIDRRDVPTLNLKSR